MSKYNASTLRDWQTKINTHAYVNVSWFIHRLFLNTLKINSYTSVE